MGNSGTNPGPEPKPGPQPRLCESCPLSCTLYPQTFEKCPVCGCPARFVPEALKEDFSVEQIEKDNPVLTALHFKYQTALHKITLVDVVDSCAKCGVIFTVARAKQKHLIIMSVPPQRGPAPRGN